MSSNNQRKELADRIEWWAMECILNAFLKMETELTLKCSDDDNDYLWEVGGIDGLMDEALHWAKYRLSTEYGKTGIVVKTMKWRADDAEVHCDFTYRKGAPIGTTGIMNDEDFVEYANLCYQALSPNSMRMWRMDNLRFRLRLRYDDINLEDCIDKYFASLCYED